MVQSICSIWAKGVNTLMLNGLIVAYEGGQEALGRNL